MPTESKEQETIVCGNTRPETLARYFKYYQQFVNTHRLVIADIDHVPFKSCYDKYRKYFDRLAAICSKYGINAHNYIEYCVKSKMAYTPDQMMSTNLIKMYADNLATRKRYATIYNGYMKSAYNVAAYCIENDTTPIDYVKMLIIKNQLAYEYVTGILSKHFIASLQNFDKIYYRLDRINRSELSTIHNVASELNNEIQEVFLTYKNQRVRPLGLVETIIKRIKNR